MTFRQPKYLLIACRVLRREAYYCAARVSPVVDVEFLPQGLHDTPLLLHESVQKLIDEKAKGYDAILLGYGLCSNGVAGLISPEVPLVAPRAHDCVTLLLGCRRRYREYFDANPGTYWYTAGWIEESEQPSGERYQKNHAEYIEKYGEENAQYLMEMEQAWISNYHRATFIDWGFDCSEQHRRFTQRCAGELQWEYDEVEGDSGLLSRMLSGCWSEDEFLLIPPGETLESALGDDVIRNVPCPMDSGKPIYPPEQGAARGRR